MTQCWDCRSTLSSNTIERDGFLVGRAADAGGPYRIYACPSCRKENRIEKLPDGRFYSSPAKEIGLVDWLFGWIEPLAPEDFLKIQNWHHQFGAERRAMFESLGDQRYSGSVLQRFLGRLNQRRRKEPAETPEGERPFDQDTTTPPEPTGPATLPHPYRILGLPSDADPEQIRARFRELVKAHHPDKIQDADRDQVEAASRRLQKLIRAYEDLERTGRV